MALTVENVLTIRADADADMGAGHVMRCLAIARAWMRQGGSAVLLAHDLDPGLQARLRRSGVAYHPLPGRWPDACDLETTRAAMRPLLRQGGGAPWLVLDGYHFTASYMSALTNDGAALCVLDDMADRPFFPASLIVNPNCYAPQLRYRGPASMRALLGSAYVLLREEFRTPKPRPEAWAESPGVNLLVTMGGGEASSVLLELQEILADTLVKKLHVRIVAGFSCSQFDFLTRLAGKQPYRCEVLGGVENMAALLDWADGAISAAGGTAWELAHAGVPAGLVVLAENQERIAATLAADGAALFLGHAPGLNRTATAAAARQLLTDVALRKKLISKGKTLVDGKGPERIVAAMKDSTHAG